MQTQAGSSRPVLRGFFLPNVGHENSRQIFEQSPLNLLENTQKVLTFDQHGYLQPCQAIETDLETFRATFVYNAHRVTIFDEYARFLEKFNAMGFTNYFQWLNGSFVTQKQAPGDLDIVTFVPWKQFEQHEPKLKRKLWNSPLLDCFFERLYPEGHPMFNVSSMDMAEWNSLYSTTRRDKHTFKRYNKGFIQLNF